MVGSLMLLGKVKSSKNRNRNRIVLIIGTAEVGGAEKQVIRLAREIMISGQKVEVWFLQGSGPLRQTLESNGVKSKDLELKKERRFKINFLFQVIKIILYLAKRDIRIIHLFLPEAIILGTHLIFTKQIKVVSSCRGETPFRGRFVEYLLKRAFRRSDAITVNSSNQTRQLVDRFKVEPEKIHLTYNGVDKTTKCADVAKEEVKCVYLANFYEYKNHKELIMNVCLCIENVHFIFIGDGPLFNPMKELVSQLGIESRVEFVGRVERPELYLEQSQLAIHASATEGLSNAILEELSVGLPVVAFDVGGNSELIQDNENGFLVPYDDWEKFQVSISQLISDRALRTKLSKNAKEISEKYSWSNSRNSFLNVYKSL